MAEPTSGATADEGAADGDDLETDPELPDIDLPSDAFDAVLDALDDRDSGEPLRFDGFSVARDAEGDDAVEPAVSTYAFSPDGATCAACGAVVEKRWRDDGDLVCPDCKQW